MDKQYHVAVFIIKDRFEIVFFYDRSSPTRTGLNLELHEPAAEL